jgi:hypothetical protein
MKKILVLKCSNEKDLLALINVLGIPIYKVVSIQDL